LGWWSAPTACYYRLLEPPPPAGDPVWKGHQPGDGAVYAATCLNTPDGFNLPRWLAAPPPGFGGVVLPAAAVLAQRALAQLPFSAMSISLAPAGRTFVHLPTFLWVTPGQWRMLSAAAAIGPRAVTLSATPVSARWDMGAGSVTCSGPGTPWDPAGPDDQASDCSYAYSRTSIDQPGSGNDRAFTVRATVTYALHWVCAGNCDEAAGDLPARLEPTATARLRVLERQSEVVPGD
jgi:hypothetical protein